MGRNSMLNAALRAKYLLCHLHPYMGDFPKSGHICRCSRRVGNKVPPLKILNRAQECSVAFEQYLTYIFRYHRGILIILVSTEK